VQSFLVANSTIANNTANARESKGGGGGISLNTREGADQTVAILQSTVTGNTAAVLGDGIYLEGYFGEQSTSVRGHGNNDADAADVGAAEFTSITIAGTIVAANDDGTEDIATSARDTVTVGLAASVIGGVAEGVVLADQGGSQLGVTDPGLAPLADNGGPTRTMALLPGSVAIDAGPDPVPDFPGNSDDQRGAGYPRVVNGRVDVGAFEVQPAVLQPTFTG